MRQAMQHERFPRARRAAGRPAPGRGARAARARDRRALEPPGARRFEAAFERTTIVTTGTASGKSLCFQLPTLRRALARRARPRAVPLSGQGARPGPGARRCTRSASSARDRRSTTATRRASSAATRRRANLVLTNPDMLHLGILPNHRGLGATSSRTSRSWWSTRRTSTAASSARTWPTCCGGCGGSCELHGTAPRFLLASATIANPGELADAAHRARGRHGDLRATARRAPSARSRCGTRRSPTRRRWRAARRWPRPPTCSPRS